MDYQDELEIAQQFPDSLPHVMFSSSSKKLSSPINSANRFFEAFPSDFKRKTGITHFQNAEKKPKASLASPKNADQTGQPQKIRSIKEFLNFQKNFANERERKISKLKEDKEKEEAEECRNTPTINSHSRRLTCHIESTCYERLSREKIVQQTPAEVEFHPKILNRSKSMNRKENVADLLYDDAQRRIEKQKVIKNEIANNLKPKINSNTDRLVVRALKAEYTQLVRNIQHIDQQLLVSILNKLFNTNFDCYKNNDASQKYQKLRNHLFKPNKQSISPKRLWAFIEISTGCRQTSLVFSQKQQKQILKQFKHFLYRNRMHKQRTKTYENQPTFRPQILKNSQRLAQRKREKMVTQAESILEKQNVKLNVNDSYELPIADLYILERMHNHEENRMKKEQDNEKEFEKCTFKPQLKRWGGIKEAEIVPISTKSSRARESFNKKASENVYQNTLFTNNTMDSIDYYQINTQTNQRKRSNSRSSMNRSFRQVKNLQSTIFRMSAGRKQKEYRNRCQQRGYPKDIENWEKFRKGQKRAIETSIKELKGYQCITPTTRNKSSTNGFIFDIYISNGVLETIHLDKYSDIISKVEELEQKYDLNEEKKIKLVKMIKSHLCSYLEKDKENTSF